MARLFLTLLLPALAASQLAAPVVWNAAGTTLTKFDIDKTAMTFTVEFTGPATGWFGVGFGESGMRNGDLWIVEGEAVQAYKSTGMVKPTLQATPALAGATVTTAAGRKTVTFTRAFAGAEKTITGTEASFSMISAWGGGATMAQHASADKGLKTVMIAGAAGPSGGPTGGPSDMPSSGATTTAGTGSLTDAPASPAGTLSAPVLAVFATVLGAFAVWA